MIRLFGFIIIAIALSLAGCLDYGSGIRIGTITSFGLQGYVFKTWQGDMARGGFWGQPLGQEHWRFCVEDARVAAQVEQIYNKGGLVKLTYTEEAFSAPWRCRGSDTYVTKAESLQPTFDAPINHIGFELAAQGVGLWSGRNGHP